MRARASLFFQTLTQCLTHMNTKSVFIFTISFLIYPRVLQVKIPRVNCISADRNSDVYPYSASVHLCLSSNTVSSPGEGPPGDGPNCCKRGCWFSWTAGTSYPKLCEFAERRWLLSPLPLPGLWGKGPEALSTTLKQRKWTSTQGQLRQTCPCLQRVEENGNCPWGLPWRSSSWESTLPMQGAWVQLLGRELDPTCCH